MAAVGVAGDVSYDVMTTATAVNVTEVTSSFAEAELLTTVTVLGVIIVATVTGNTFVIAAVVLERNLRNHVANYLVASLAVADLMVALLVMPLAAVNEVCPPLSCVLVVCISLREDPVVRIAFMPVSLFSVVHYSIRFLLHRFNGNSSHVFVVRRTLPATKLRHKHGRRRPYKPQS